MTSWHLTVMGLHHKVALRACKTANDRQISGQGVWDTLTTENHLFAAVVLVWNFNSWIPFSTIFWIQM